MKTFLLCALVIGGFMEVAQGVAIVSKKLNPQTCSTCTGATPCTACRTCSACKWCSKDGGTCGICKPKQR